MPDLELLRDFDWTIDYDELAAKMRVRRGTRQEEELRSLLCHALEVGRPKALYGAVYIDERGEDYLVLDGARFTSRVLRVNLEHAHRVFVYCCTCGTELAEWTNGLTDMLQRFWAEGIQMAALRSSSGALSDQLEKEYHIGQASSQAPGSLPNWPLQQQRELFSLLGDTERLIGVRLTDHYVMIPAKSVSGIRFPTETHFESCQLCPREGCPGRRLDYEPSLYENKYLPS